MSVLYRRYIVSNPIKNISNSMYIGSDAYSLSPTFIVGHYTNFYLAY